MEIEAGKVAVIRSSREVVFVLETSHTNSPGWYQLSGDLVTVKRPVATEHGIIHNVEEFYAEELMTVEAEQEERYTKVSTLKRQLGLFDDDSRTSFKN